MARTRADQAAATRSRLVRAARDVFERDGYRGASVAAITREAETAHGTFYLHFTNKEAIFGEVLREAIDGLNREAGRPWPPGDREAATAEAMRRYLVAFGERAALWRGLLEAMLDSEDVERAWLELRDRFFGRIARNLRRGQAAGEVRDLDPDLAAQALGAMVEWFAFTHVSVRGASLEGAELDAAVTTLAGLWARAVAP